MKNTIKQFVKRLVEHMEHSFPAKGKELVKLADMYGIKKKPGESDEALRNRILQKIEETNKEDKQTMIEDGCTHTHDPTTYYIKYKEGGLDYFPVGSLIRQMDYFYLQDKSCWTPCNGKLPHDHHPKITYIPNHFFLPHNLLDPAHNHRDPGHNQALPPILKQRYRYKKT